MSACFDRQTALARLGGDEQVLRELAALFLREAPKIVAQLAEALARDDVAGVQQSAHKLKSGVSNFFSTSVREVLEDLEATAARGDVAKLTVHWQRLQDPWADLERSLADFLEEAAAERGADG